jgi:hypothetical protein
VAAARRQAPVPARALPSWRNATATRGGCAGLAVVTAATRAPETTAVPPVHRTSARTGATRAPGSATDGPGDSMRPAVLQRPAASPRIPVRVRARSGLLCQPHNGAVAAIGIPTVHPVDAR